MGEGGEWRPMVVRWPARLCVHNEGRASSGRVVWMLPHPLFFFVSVATYTDAAVVYLLSTLY